MQLVVSFDPVQTGGKSALVSEQLFSANLLFNRDREVNASGEPAVSEAFREAFQDLGATAFRYPGGAITEKYFDLSNPNRSAGMPTVGPEAGTGNAVPLLPLDAAFEFAEQTGAHITIVLPTYPYLGEMMDSQGNRFESVDSAELRSFIRYCLTEAAERGVTVDYFEIGNEWYVDGSDELGCRMTPTEYGRIASRMVEVIDGAMNELLDDGLDVAAARLAIQVGPGGSAEQFQPNGQYIDAAYSGPTVSATSLIFAEFGRIEERQGIDALISHRYLTGNDTNVNGWRYEPMSDFAAMASGVPGFGQLDFIVTEWNVAARNDEELGLPHAGNILTLFSEMLAAGVDYAAIWAVQQNNRSAMSTSSGRDGEPYEGLTAAGTLYSWMRESLPGLTLQATQSSISSVETFFFTGEDRSVVYVFNDSPAQASFLVAEQQAITDLHLASVKVLSPSNGDTSEGTASTYELTQQEFRTDDGDIFISMDPYDVMQFDFLAETGIAASRDTKGRLVFNGSEVSDVIFGEAKSSFLRGNSGHDALYGQDAADQIEGGTGNDSLFGAGGKDVVSGGDGDDLIYGGTGKDRLAGDLGADTIYGGSDKDLIYTGGGSDRAWGGDGDDRIWFGNGDDVVFGGAGADRFTFEVQSGASIIGDYDGSVDRLVFVPAAGSKVRSALVDWEVTDTGVDLSFENGASLFVKGASYEDFLGWHLQ